MVTMAWKQIEPSEYCENFERLTQEESQVIRRRGGECARQDIKGTYGALVEHIPLSKTPQSVAIHKRAWGIATQHSLFDVSPALLGRSGTAVW